MAVIINDNPIITDQANEISYPSISGLMGRVGINVTTRAIQSDNFVTGASGAGWQLTAEGNFEGTSGTFRGALAATSGTIGGFTITSVALTATGVNIASDTGIATLVTFQTGTSGSRMSLNANTLSFFPSSGVAFMTISNGNSEIDITHEGIGPAIDIDYKASGARGFNLTHLQDANQVSCASTDSTVLYVDRTSGSSSAKNLVDIFNAGGTGVPLEIRQNSTATKAALRIYQQDVSETAVFIGTNTAVTEADIGLLEVVPVTAGTVGIYISPSANVAHMRWAEGSAPASPVDGDFWFDGTNLKFQDGASTRTITWS